MAMRHAEELRTADRDLLSNQEFALLIERARQRQPEAVAALYERAMPTVYRYVMARLHQVEIVEDVVADIFLTMVENISNLRTSHEAGFFAWIFKIAHAKIVRRLQILSQMNTRLVPLPQGYDEESMTYFELAATDLGSDPVALQEWREQIGELGVALATLPSDQQHVIFARFIDDQSIEVISSEMGRNPGAIRALQFRGLERLAVTLGKIRSHTDGRGRSRRTPRGDD